MPGFINHTNNLTKTGKTFNSRNLNVADGDELQDRNTEVVETNLTDGDFISTNGDWATSDFLMNNGSA